MTPQFSSAPYIAQRSFDGERTKYRLNGELPLLWAERIASAAAANGFDVESLIARRENALWDATVTVRGEAHLDVTAIVGREGSWSLGRTHEIDGFHVGRLPHGWITLTVSGSDEPGFLASLLSHLRQLTLFPIALDVAAEQGLAIDSFELAGLGGGIPANGTENALVTMLSLLTRPKAQRAAV